MPLSPIRVAGRYLFAWSKTIVSRFARPRAPFRMKKLSSVWTSAAFVGLLMAGLVIFLALAQS